MRALICLWLAMVLVACNSDESPEPAPASESGSESGQVADAGDSSAAEPAGETAEGSEAARVVVYTSRQPQLIEPLFERFTEQTGIQVDFITDAASPLIERIAAEGERTVADLLITVDAGNLWHAAERGILRPVESAKLAAAIPASLRDAENRWFGLSKRARALVYHPERVDTGNLSTYAALADDAWADRLCLRTSKKVYNQSLVAMMIEHHGEQKVEEIVSGWVENLAAPPFSSDTRLIEAIAAGQCDVGIVNSYYLGRMQADDPDFPVQIFWPNQSTTGTHVNISGAGVIRHAPRPQQAIRLLEWLAGEDAQAEFAAQNLEFPVVEGVEAAPVAAAWGEFRADDTNLAVAGRRQAEAVKLMDRVGYR